MMCRIQIRRLLCMWVLVAIIVSVPAAADTQVVSDADLQKEIVAASQLRQQNLETVKGFVTSERAQKAIKSARLDVEQVKNAVSMLDDKELAQLASRAEKAQADFAAGRLSDHDLVLIILGIVALIVIIVLVRVL
jgi:hypothetical protein